MDIQNTLNPVSGRPPDVSELALVRRFEDWSAPYLRRAHLPRSPIAPAMQILLGVLAIVAIDRLLESQLTGLRPIAVATTAIGAALVTPALGMILEGAWSLAREPLQYFRPAWYARLMALFAPTEGEDSPDLETGLFHASAHHG